ncbi:unnamed protein product [Hymenolepis diminuta]|uniref:Uncharacterized protein n=1 Tax=Hymenolepis diminuta TaxID=6216 RepID=A0A564Z2Y4_HYMDI|nr:unnamed protein product [Hymenolepis diminuta]
MFTMLYPQGTQSSLVHLPQSGRLLQPAQQFTCVIIGRMAHKPKVSSELSLELYEMGVDSQT